jgi:hypothetical protein
MWTKLILSRRLAGPISDLDPGARAHRSCPNMDRLLYFTRTRQLSHLDHRVPLATHACDARQSSEVARVAGMISLMRAMAASYADTVGLYRRERYAAGGRQS